MSYKIVTPDGTILGQAIQPVSAVLDQQCGYAGELTIVLQPDHPLYDRMIPRQTMVTVQDGSETIFVGEVKSYEIDTQKLKTVIALDRLSWLADSIQPQKEYHSATTNSFLTSLLLNHRNQISGSKKKIYPGTVSAQLAESIYRMTNRETTLEAIRDKLTDRIGGFLKLRESSGSLYLDYLTIEDYGKISNQSITFGDNLLSYAANLSANEIYTGIVPIGARIDEENANESPLEKRVTIESVNDGKEYLVNESAAAIYGHNFQVVEWDDVGIPSILKSKAQSWLQENCLESLTIEVTAADLRALGVGYDSFRIGDRVRVQAKPYGLDKVIPIMELSTDLMNPADTVLVLSDATVAGSDSLTAQIRAEGKKQTELMNMYNADVQAGFDKLQTELNKGKKGYKLTQYDEDGNWIADLYMDSMDPDAAQNVIKITVDGIGFSTKGINGPFNVGITIDGHIMAWMITAQSITAAQLTQDCKTTIINDALTSATAEMDERLRDYITATEIETKLQTTADSITAGVYSSVRVADVNMIDGTFTMDCAYGLTSGATLASASGLYKSGAKALTYVGTTRTDYTPIGYIDQQKLEPDMDYVFTAWVKGRTLGADRFALSLLRVSNSSQSITSAYVTDYQCLSDLKNRDNMSAKDEPEYKSNFYFVPITSYWKKIDIKFHTPADIKKDAEFYIRLGCTGNLYLALPMLCRGTVPAEWQPSQADVDATYATKSELKIERDKISAVVSAGSSSTSWVLNKSAFTVCFNSLSDYLQMTSGEIEVMDTAGKAHTILGRNGLAIYKTDGNTELGHIGRAVWADNDSLQGLAFNLNYYGNYMTWGYRTSSTATTYTTQLVYYADGGTGHKKGFDLGDNFYAESYLYIGDDSKTGHFTQFTDGTVGWTGTNFYFENGKVVAGGGLTVSYGASCDVWTNVNMHGFNLTNTSDSRLKTNIEPDTHDALEIINSVDIVRYDWADGHGSDFGLIAQQLESVAPDLVSTDSNGIKSIKLDRLLMLAIKAIQELSPTARSAKAEWTDDMTDEEKVEFATALNPVVRPKYERRKPKLMYRMLEEDEEDVDHGNQTE